MATLTALAVVAGSAALVGSAFIAKQMKGAPEPVAEPTQKPVAEPVVNPAPLPESPPETPGATAPSLPEQPGDEMAGGAIGRPPWGVISSNVTATTVDSTGNIVADALGLKVDPRQLYNEIVQANKQLEETNYKMYKYDEVIARIQSAYIRVRNTFAMKTADAKTLDSLISDLNKKLNPQQNTEGKKALNKIIGSQSATEAEKAEAKRKLAEMGESKVLDESTLDKLRDKQREAIEKKIEADDDVVTSTAEKNKYAAQLTEARTKKDELETASKTLKAKLDGLLARYRAYILTNKRKQGPPLDLEARKTRYAQAVDRKDIADSNMRSFYSEIWLPNQYDKVERQRKYGARFSILELALKSAADELEAAKNSLLASPQVLTTPNGTDFQIFVAEIDEITEEAVDGNGNIQPAFAVQPTNPGSGYPEDVRILKEYAKKPRLAAAADVYYEIAKSDATTLIRNIPKYMDFFNRIAGLRRGQQPEREKTPGVLGGVDITRDVLKNFVTVILERAANSVVPYNSSSGDRNTNLYNALREKTNEFVDKQISLIRRMYAVIRNAKRTVKASDLAGKNLIELETLIKSLIPLPASVPPTGRCEMLIGKDLLDLLKSGQFEGKDILADVLSNGADHSLTSRFLTKIGFTKIHSIKDAQNLVRTSPNPLSMSLLVSAIVEEYVKLLEKSAFENPDGMVNTIDPKRFISLLGMSIQTNPNLEINQYVTSILRSAGANPVADNYLNVSKNYRAELDDPNSNLIRLDKAILIGTSQKFLLEQVRNSCEIDGNVGSGKDIYDRMIKILDEIGKMDKEETVLDNPLLKLIDRLEQDGKIDLSRPDQAKAIDFLGNKGFTQLNSQWSIISVEQKDKALNFVQTFLTLRNARFRSIPYEDTISYDGKRQNTRKVFAKLALDEMFKGASFESRSAEEKRSFPSDEDWGRISVDFNNNFIIYNEQGRTTRPTVDSTVAGRRVGAVGYNVFRDVNGLYFPIRKQTSGIENPAVPSGLSAQDFDFRNRRPLEGGAIQGVVMDLPPNQPPPISYAKEGLNKLVTGAQSLGSTVYTAAQKLRQRTELMNAQIAEGTAHKKYMLVDYPGSTKTAAEKTAAKEELEAASERVRLAREAIGGGRRQYTRRKF